VALSTSESEYIATSVEIHEAMWLRKLLAGIFDLELEATLIHCENQSCVKLTEKPIFHDSSKHIEIKCHYIRDMVQRGAVELQYTSTD
jgi:aspartate carbamoyltransferase regulatory subunit